MARDQSVADLTRAHDLGVTKRDFLLTSGAAVGTGFVYRSGSGIETAPLADIVLRESDLSAAEGDPYVDRSARPADAALVGHYRRSVPQFSDADVALSGFETTARASVPTHVESAAIDRERGWTPEALAVATDAWLRGPDRDAAGVSLDRSVGAGGVQWVSTGQHGTVDVLRLRATAAGPVVLTIAHGDGDANLSPTDAVDEYERTMRRRVQA